MPGRRSNRGAGLRRAEQNVGLFRDLSESRGSNLLIGALSGVAGAPGDISELPNVIPVPENIQLYRALVQHALPKRMAPTADEIGNFLGANTRSPSFMVGDIGAPDPKDLGRFLGAMTLFHGTPHRLAAPRAMPQVPVNGREQYKAFVEQVSVDDLLQMPGNRLGKTDLSKLKREIIEDGGLKEPIIIQVGKNDRTAVVGEGNHRVQAAKELGYEYVPTRVIVQRETHTPIPGQKRDDLIPEADKYFKSDAKPSEVLRDIAVQNGETVSKAK